jgi:hypothetical protein
VQKGDATEAMKYSAHDEDQFGIPQREYNDGGQDVVQPDIKFASRKEQSPFYGDIPDYDPTDYQVVKVGQGSPRNPKGTGGS